MFEYGSRCGIWRLLRLFDDKNIPVTLFPTGLALELNPLLCDYLKDSIHEIAGHGYRWLNYRYFIKAGEKIHFQKTLDIIQTKTKKMFQDGILDVAVHSLASLLSNTVLNTTQKVTMMIYPTGSNSKKAHLINTVT